MICEKCEQLGGFEGDPPAVACYLVTVVSPPAEAEANPPEVLCAEHANQATAAYLGWGWGIHADLLPEFPELRDCCRQHVGRYGVMNPTICKCGLHLVVRDRRWQYISSLWSPGTNTTPTGG